MFIIEKIQRKSNHLQNEEEKISNFNTSQSSDIIKPNLFISFSKNIQNNYTEGFTNNQYANNLSCQSSRRKKYAMYSTEVKRKCIENSKFNDLKTVSQLFAVPLKSLRRWIQIGPERLKGAGRKVRDKQMERKLFEWYEDNKRNDILITSKMIKAKALEFTSLNDFNASKGWFAKFKKKYNLVLYSQRGKR